MAGKKAYHVAASALIGVAIIGASAEAGTNCKCRAYGKDYEQGQLACIRGKLAMCGMFLNNSSWKIIGEICPQSSIAPQPLLIVHLRGKVTGPELPAC